MELDKLISECKNWFKSRNIDSVVIGFSGGIDSAFTSALLGACNVNVHLVIAEAPNQNYSSPMGGAPGAKSFCEGINLNAEIHKIDYNFIFPDNLANEAAAPIQRVACFYGVCAKLRNLQKRAIVVGTVNFDESAYLGFWGKASDAALDFYPISHLHKSEIYNFAKNMSMPVEILESVPSGDLLFRKTNDLEMIGANYNQIEAVAKMLENECSENELRDFLKTIFSLKIFCKQIINNNFKYELPFPGFHLNNRLEIFRQKHYLRLIQLVNIMDKKHE
jgi:NAD+ synthetase